MANIIKTNMNRIVPKLVPITPYELYLQQVKGTYDSIRSYNADSSVTYIPPQFGGFMGQKEVLEQKVVLELTDFEAL